MLEYLKSLVRREEGQTMVEYALLVFLISIAAIAVILLIGPQLIEVFTQVVEALGGVVGG
jgi:pilus assembly protein Flp/PilA